MAQQILSVPNANGSGHQIRERSVHESSTASDTAYEGGEQTSPTPTNSSSCTACSKIDWDTEELEEREDNPNKPLHGWPALAKEMEKRPEFEAFPTFRDLNIKSLLYYQAELDGFRHQLQRCEWRDHCGNAFKDSDTLNSDVHALLKCKGKSNRIEKQLNLITDMRKVLKQYNAALLQYSQINALPEADDINVHSLRTWLINPALGNREIKGHGAEAWGDLAPENNPKTPGQQFGILVKSVFWPAKQAETKHKLVVPQKSKEVDGFTRWVAEEWVPFWQKVTETDFWKNLPWNRPLGHEKQCEIQFPVGMQYKDKSTGSIASSAKRWKRNIFQRTKPHEDAQEDIDQSSKHEVQIAPTMKTYTMSSMLQFTSLVATLIACLLPIVAITVLSKVHTQPKILGFMALFTALFAIGLMWLTNPGTARTEIFTATAAFSAVLVVFVQNQNGNTNGS